MKIQRQKLPNLKPYLALGYQFRKPILIIIGILTILGILRYNFDFQLDQIIELVHWVRDNFGWQGAFVAGLIYALLLSIPFFPGVELAWIIILFYGKDAVGLIYLTTLLGLTLSFSVGRLMKMGVRTGSNSKMDKLEGKYNELFDRTSCRIHGFFSAKSCNLFFNRLLHQTHYLVLAILINIPGNSILGGGGGIALLSGMNRSFSYKGFMLTLIAAISPLPILIYFGLVQIESLLM